MGERSDKDQVTAYHEAGHAVGAFLLGVPIRDIILGDPDSGQGAVKWRLTIAEIRQADLGWQHAVVAMLGRAAEQSFFGRGERRFLGEDAECVARLYLTYFAETMTCHEYRAEIRKRTEEIASHPGFLRSVRALAEVLENERVVAIERAHEIIRGAMTLAPMDGGGLPVPEAEQREAAYHVGPIAHPLSGSEAAAPRDHDPAASSTAEGPSSFGLPGGFPGAPVEDNDTALSPGL